MMPQMIYQRVADIEKRNLVVEGIKKLETSWIRRLTIAVLTYVTVILYHFIINVNDPFILSPVPVIGFMLFAISLQSIIRRFFDKGIQ